MAGDSAPKSLYDTCMSFVVRNAPGRLDWTNVPDIIADEIVRQILSTTDYFETPGHEAEALFKGLAEGSTKR